MSAKLKSSQSLIGQAQRLLPEKGGPELKRFFTAFFDGVAADDMAMLGAAGMAEIAVQHQEMRLKRKAGKPLVEIRLVNPKKRDADMGLTLIDIVNDDMAFLVDSIAAEIGRYDRLIDLLIHPVLPPARKDMGAAVESHMHIRLQGALAESVAAGMRESLMRVLGDVSNATRDWKAMRERLKESGKIIADAPENRCSGYRQEYIEFLDYLYRDNFTLLGYREYRFTEKNGVVRSETVRGSSLGLLQDDVRPVYLAESVDGLSPALQKLRRGQMALSVSKVNRRSTVHRPVPLDAVAVKVFDKSGQVSGERLFMGLFTSVTYSRSIQDIPWLRLKAEEAMNASGFRAGSHDYKALRHILEKYPRDELFQMDMKAMLETGLGILRLQERRRIALYTRHDPFGRYVSCLVYVPRDRYDTRLRTAIQSILEEELGGKCGDYYINLDDSPLARVLLVINTSQSDSPRFDPAKIEERLREAGRSWDEKLSAALLEAGTDEDRIPEIVLEYGRAFPIAYQEHYTPKQAVYDIGKIGEALGTRRLALDLYRCKLCNERQLRLKIYSRGMPVILSDILPILENMGLVVLSELPFEIRPHGAGTVVWVHDFMMENRGHGIVADMEASKAPFEEALARIWYGEMEDDSLNHLVLLARMDWREIMVLRTYVRYLRQVGTSFSTRFIERALYGNIPIARKFVDLFRAMHDPGTKDREGKIAACNAALDAAFEKVVSLDEDRVLRSILDLARATLRTNFFQPGSDGALKPYLSIKLDSRSIEELPHPRPYREIFVYSPRVEGVHLRNDAIARGGIRWSDRHEDFRTEVLGLMKAQQVKNALIVPMGAKGGFVVKKPPKEGGRPAYLQEGIECYKILVRGLLDLTDNRKGKKVVPPRAVVRRDGDDPYLVVAADKGTATFSDIANGLSAEYGFWLGDAFASGGSAGYDHKKMGITAKGAWESVKRHFRELNHDTQKKPFDVIGVGDMGGDVFGNGMLLSEHIRLVGAFNHVHIFCDPNPDSAASLKERARLFQEVKGWDGYDVKLLSKGGRVYARSDKSLHLTPEIMKRFDISREKVAPAELIQAMLRARADLLWFGGIGTYVKATHETHGDVGDKGNDSLRVDASEVRAKVIGEGANLAVTQAARIEMAERGVKLNADFIDNSGGVNSSDIEVNIKILLTDVVANPAHAMTLAKRNKLLESMTDEVAQLVLRNNYQQAQAISLMELQGPENLSSHARFISALERHHGLGRKLEGLPDEEDIQARQRQGKGLERPELATLQAHAKILFSRDLLASDIPDMPEMEPSWLCGYFPGPLRRKYAAEIRGHRLRREIMATSIAVAVVNRMGPTFVKGVMDKTGASSADVARAYLTVQEAFGLSEMWDRIEALDGTVPAQVQLRALREISRMAARETTWFLTRLGRPVDVARDIADFSRGVKMLRGNLDGVMTKDLGALTAQRMQANRSDGLPADLARDIAFVPPLGAACDIIRVSLERGADIPLTAKIYFELGDFFHIHWLRGQARFVTAGDRWSSEAISGMIEQLYGAQTGLTGRILSDMKGEAKIVEKGGAAELVGRWIAKAMPQAEQVRSFMADLRASGGVDLPVLVIAEQRLRQMAGG